MGLPRHLEGRGGWTTSGDEVAAPKKGNQGKKGKGGRGPKAPTQAAQKDKTIEMQKETIAKKDAEVAKKDVENAQLRAENARLRSGTPATGQPTQEPAPAHSVIKPGLKKEPVSHARQRPASPQPAERAAPAETGSPLKRPPSLHVMAQRASALSPSRPHPLLLRRQPGSRGDRLIEKRQIARTVLEYV
jgi:hypothetical protein